MPRIWGRRNSSNVQAVMWCVGELGLAYERYDVGHRFGGTDTDAFVAMNPNRTVPVLRDGEGPALWESGAILRYLASRYAGDTPFWPGDLDARANVDRWAEWSKINVAMAFTVPIFWRVVRLPAADRGRPARRRRLAGRSRVQPRRRPVRPPPLSLLRHRHRAPAAAPRAGLLRAAPRTARLPGARGGVLRRPQGELNDAEREAPRSLIARGSACGTSAKASSLYDVPLSGTYTLRGRTS